MFSMSSLFKVIFLSDGTLWYHESIIPAGNMKVNKSRRDKMNNDDIIIFRCTAGIYQARFDSSTSNRIEINENHNRLVS